MTVTRNMQTRVLTAGLFALTLGMAQPGTVQAEADPHWRPRVSEKLVKLPNAYLKKALDKDFKSSALAGALTDIEQEMKFKKQTLGDLRQAREQAEGELRVELNHQFLAEKKAYLDLVTKRQDLKRRHLKTRIRLYERVLRKMGRDHSGRTKAQAKLAESQARAHARFEQSVEKVDLALFEESVAQQSKYAKEYAKNLTAIRSLAAAIENHAMTQRTLADAAANESKPEYLRGLIAGAEADLALLTQEREIVGYMAKLVALDAQALAEDIQEETVASDEPEEEPALADVVGLYIQ